MNPDRKQWLQARPCPRQTVAAFIDSRYVNCVVSAVQDSIQPDEVRLVRLDNREEIVIQFVLCKKISIVPA